MASCDWFHGAARSTVQTPWYGAAQRTGAELSQVITNPGRRRTCLVRSHAASGPCKVTWRCASRDCVDEPAMPPSSSVAGVAPVLELQPSSHSCGPAGIGTLDWSGQEADGALEWPAGEAHEACFLHWQVHDRPRELHRLTAAWIEDIPSPPVEGMNDRA